ncbi:OmpA family protein [Roseibaca sp. V10]|uniref:OmpA family protein n=1 Tax=Roseinatronobacter domitianus TaxID=2940293 RepID=A0ABT0M2K1_9RHOB|nr:OmpA family protein [Roseibaca domitiana]MCL1629082.1 OmpA family protein [Roseibaca domitiana]
MKRFLDRLLSAATPLLIQYKWYGMTGIAFVAAALLALGGAQLSARALENVVARETASALITEGLDWAEVETDGLLLRLSGEAPTEASRFNAISTANQIVSAERILDEITVKPATEIAAPDFSMEILRNGLDVQMVGLVPWEFDLSAFQARVEAVDAELSVENMLETAGYPEPFAWASATDFALSALASLNAAKISISPGRVNVVGLTGSEDERDRIRIELARERPRDVIAALDISAPRPAISPFTLRFVLDEDGARFDACAADTQDARSAILNSARAAGASGRLECIVGLGAPTPDWQDGVVAALDTIAQMGAGTVTFSDTDVTMVVPATVGSDVFDRRIGALEGRLPDAFSLDAVRLPPSDSQLAAVQDQAEFGARLLENGAVMLSGRLTDARTRDAVRSLAQANFGPDAVTMAARLDPDLPGGWPLKALLAVDVLSYLNTGTVRVVPDRVEISGVSGLTDASDQISRLLADKLGQRAVFALDVTYDEAFDPIAQLPTPARCKGWIDEIITDRKITFDPGSTSITGDAIGVLDEIAEVLRGCGRMSMEVAGHTDSQGRLETNMRLSQQRAEAVVAGLMARGALVSEFVAKGYGPEFPIADNATESGREDNRRIEFSLIGASLEAARAELAPEGNTPAEDAELQELPDESELAIPVSPGEDAALRPRTRPDRAE